MNSTEGQSAAMQSPFTPIADYGFLSDCHTGALVAPDGGVDWLCVPRFDSPSVFGSLLDREAGTFRFGPFGINVPTQRVYDAGTNVLVDHVEDAVGVGRRQGRAHDRADPRARRGHAAHPPTGRRRRRARPRPHGRVHRRPGRDGAGVRAGLRLRRDPGQLDAGRRRQAHRRRHRRRRDRAAAHRHGRRHRGRTGPGPPHAACR